MWAWLMLGLWWATVFMSGSERVKVLVQRVAVTAAFCGACVAADGIVAELVAMPTSSLGVLAFPLYVVIAILFGLTHLTLVHHGALQADRLLPRSLVFVLFLGWIPSSVYALASKQYDLLAAAAFHALLILIALSYAVLQLVACIRKADPQRLRRMAGFNLAALATAVVVMYVTVPCASRGFGILLWFYLWPVAIVAGFISMGMSLVALRIAASRKRSRDMQ